MPCFWKTAVKIADRRDYLLSLAPREMRAALERMSDEQRRSLRTHWQLWAHPGQLDPAGEWHGWLIMAGRGFGKTRAGAEWVRSVAENDPTARIALIAASLGEARSVMIEGESGLLAISPWGKRPRFEPSRRLLTWSSGAQATLYSAAEPETLRGPQHSHAWCDEIAKWETAADRAMRSWDNMLLGLRLGEQPRLVATTTPRSVPLVRRLADDPAIRITRGSTFANKANLPPRFIANIRREDGWPTAYAYRVGERVLTIPVLDGDASPNLIHIKGFHPGDDHYGAGCLAAADQAVAIHNAASNWNRNLLENAARPSGALVYDTGDSAGLTADQFDRLKAELARAFSGDTNAGRPMLLEGGLKWQSLSLSPADMDFATLKAAAARDVALAFGVPPMLLGLPGDATYANYREANRALWRLTLLPLSAKLLSALAEGLATWFPDARLAVDLDQIPALAEDRERLWSQVSAAAFLSDAEKRTMLGLAADISRNKS